ncbi:phosphatase regulatory subunit [Penicillium alfredii]|uniref:Phosphatase regulatory subunit n=1 Tax=Penicillium alfredii TaxID=1506179 RepID=A0A9W9ELD8_9EURO|nr:phosphatase regulatory subunit [Penicillium alfredii]KAJ5083947.1 phosphatase regulatory subunit [Penicillium alfredii]
MPYTAPLKPLLSVQHIEYCGPCPEPRPERPGLARSSSGRLQNSRSYSSTSYVRRHRRSPSICKSTDHPASDPVSRLSPSIDPHASLRQSPPPLNNATIPPGAVISPPESAPNSSDEESPYQTEGITPEELEAAVRSIEQEKERSPERMDPVEQLGTEAPSSSSGSPLKLEPKPTHLPLSKGARKVAHSRSATETAITWKREEALTSSPEDSDVEHSPKPPMVRKKSGELVRPALRPASARRRPSSMPGTPVYAKAVHFDSQLEHIRHFLQLDRPLAVSAETSPVDSHDADCEFPFGRNFEQRAPEWEWEVRLANFPKDTPSRATLPVRLERLFLSPDKKTLIGNVAVANLAFQKHVAARFTFDYWRTVSEVTASFCHDIRRKQVHDGYDRFSFEIKLNDHAYLERKTMSVCVRYSVNGQEFWDNNNSMNYQVDFFKSPKTAPSKPSGGSRPSVPRSRSFTGSHLSRPHSTPPPPFDDFPETGGKVAFTNPFAAVNGAPLARASSDDIDTIAPPKPREKPSPQAFGNRYDFGASLSAAMRTKPPVDRTTLTARARSGRAPEADITQASETSPSMGLRPTSPVSDDIRDASRVEDLKPSSFVSSKPRLESSVYKELVDKYCFVGALATSSQNTSLTCSQYGSPNGSNLKQSNATTGASDRGLSRQSASGSPSPPLSPRSPAPLEPPSAEPTREPRHSPMSPPPHSPRTSPRTSPSPMSFRFPFHDFMNDSQSSTVIRG